VPPPFLSGFTRRKEIRYGTVFPGANLTDFPKLFNIVADGDVAAQLSGGGGIAITKTDGVTTTPFGIYPSSVPSTGNLLLRAKFDLLTAAVTGDVLGYLYYDGSGVTTEDKAGTVSNSYAMFMPMEEDPSGSAPQMFDWVTGTNIGTSAGGMTSGDLVTGQVGKCLEMDNTDMITVPDTPALRPAQFTFEILFYADTIAAGTGTYWDKTDSAGSKLSIGSSSVLSASQRFATPATLDITLESSVTTDAWHRAATRYDGTTFDGYYDNTISETSQTNTDGTSHSTNDWILNNGFTTFSRMDEWRISSVARSNAWLEYTYTDEFTNSDTFTLGPEEVGLSSTASVWLIRA
jgi:hypothetical protein